jgi:hypothetical protein
VGPASKKIKASNKLDDRQRIANRRTRATLRGRPGRRNSSTNVGWGS